MPAAICHVRGLHYVGAHELFCGLNLPWPAAIAFLLFVGELKAIRLSFTGDDDPAHDPPLPWQVRALILVWQCSHTFKVGFVFLKRVKLV